jgi:hypothetical protein
MEGSAGEEEERVAGVQRGKRSPLAQMVVVPPPLSLVAGSRGGRGEEEGRGRGLGGWGWGGVGKVEVGTVCARIISFFITAPGCLALGPDTIITPVIYFLLIQDHFLL